MLEFSQSFAMQLVGQKVMYDLRKQLFLHLQRLELAFFDRNPVGRLVTRVTTDVDVLNDLFSSGVVAIFGDFFTLLSIMVVMLYVNWKLALLTFAVLPVIAVVTGSFRRAVRDSYRRIRTAIARINAYLQEHLTGMAVMQLFNREDRSFDEFETANRAHMEAYKDSILAYGLFFPAVELVGVIAVAIILYYGRGDGLARRRQRGHGHRLHPVLAAILPPHSGFERQVQLVAGGDGEFGAHLQAAGYARDDRRSSAAPAACAPARTGGISRRRVRLQGRPQSSGQHQLRHRAG